MSEKILITKINILKLVRDNFCKIRFQTCHLPLWIRICNENYASRVMGSRVDVTTK